jgi:hypothetical protein
VAGVELAPWLLAIGVVGVAGTLLAMVLHELLAGRRLARHLPPALVGAALGALVLATFLLWPEDNKAFIYFQF